MKDTILNVKRPCVSLWLKQYMVNRNTRALTVFAVRHCFVSRVELFKILSPRMISEIHLRGWWWMAWHRVTLHRSSTPLRRSCYCCWADDVHRGTELFAYTSAVLYTLWRYDATCLGWCWEDGQDWDRGVECKHRRVVVVDGGEWFLVWCDVLMRCSKLFSKQIELNGNRIFSLLLGNLQFLLCINNTFRLRFHIPQSCHSLWPKWVYCV